ncbi:MAG: T9SS type A sorting domain-containing protein [Flavobacterium sp.]|nr:T9SS type A sorting domain-containing protein [Flavobacterium sp.]
MAETHDVALYPNPCQDQFRLANFEGNATYLIINSLGQTVQQGMYVQDEFITTNQLNSGIYFLKIKNKSMKLIKN